MLFPAKLKKYFGLMSNKNFGNLNFVRIHCFDSNPYCNEDNYIKGKIVK